MELSKSKIDWPGLTHVWNPVIGCKRNCPWECWAKRMNNRFKWIPKWTKPVFFPDRLKVKMPKKPSKIFIGSMSDICYWRGEWITATLNIVEDNPQNTFMFLTKSPKIYDYIRFPLNCQLGFTLTNSANHQRGNTGFFLNQNNYKFVSLEPLLGSFVGMNFNGINIIIVGAQTGKEAIEPKQKWIESIVHPNIHYKKNILRYIK